MTIFQRLSMLASIAEDEFSDILKEPPKVLNDRVQFIFIDESIMAVRYPVENKYSFHWQRGANIYRINTAPHHKDIPGWPRHIHDGTEDNVIEDRITDLTEVWRGECNRFQSPSKFQLCSPLR